MEYSTMIQPDYKGSFCLKVFVPFKHTLQILNFISGLDTGSKVTTSAFSIIIYDDKNVLQYINYELDKFIEKIESAERCYNELFMEVQA